MDSRIPSVRSDVVTVPSAPRPTPAPVRVSFGEVLARGAGALVAGAEAAMNVLPGGPLVAAALRNGVGGGSSTMMASGPGNGLQSALDAEGPSPASGSSLGGGLGGVGGTGTGAGGGIEQSLQQSQEMNLYFLQIQQEVDQQNRTFTTLSNVLKAENDTVKNAIGNLR